jgi:large subunit ribosomal protein L6
VLQGKNLSLSLGFASPKDYPIPTHQGHGRPAGLNVTVEGISKELVGEAAARIRSYYPAEPYKGKVSSTLANNPPQAGKTVA